MSTALNDVASAALVAAAVAPTSVSSSPTGSAVDMISADGPCFAIQQVGSFTGTSLDGRIEESADATTWTAIGGATFDPVTGSNDVQAISFVRTARYVRYAADLTGSEPLVALAVVVGEQKKTI